MTSPGHSGRDHIPEPFGAIPAPPAKNRVATGVDRERQARRRAAGRGNLSPPARSRGGGSAAEGIRQSLYDVANGRTGPAREVFDAIRAEYDVPR